MRRLICVLLLGVVFSGCLGSKKEAAAPAPAVGPAPKAEKKAEKKSPAARRDKAAKKQPAKAAPSALSVTNNNAVVTLADAQVGRVASINPGLRFVVVDFSLNRVPAVGDRLSVFRQGIKVGEVKISGPQLNNNITADVILGEVQPGDEVRRD
jgi:hypothetical protein